jgi:hypothetical protein
MVSPEDLSLSLVGSNLHVFTIAELRAVTRDFSMTNFIGEGGFGPVYKGYVDDKTKPGLRALPVAVKLLDLEGGQGHTEWLVIIYTAPSFACTMYTICSRIELLLAMIDLEDLRVATAILLIGPDNSTAGLTERGGIC